MSALSRLLALTATLGMALLIFPNSGASFFPEEEDDLPPPKFSVETRGPVHEAFAQPNEGKPILNAAVQKEPPPPLPERPPAQKPDNPNLEWIPGYWAWDADRNDFLWVSGTFRDPPPGRRWVPGHWTNGDQGWTWVPGFWAGENQADLNYTPEPPAALENGPSTAAPDSDSGYVPGYWYYDSADQRFAWRPGYWAPYRDGRVWVSPQYYWTPRGYVFVDGYWDYPLANRGLLFAPAYFPTPLWNDPNWSYQPSYVVPSSMFLDSGFYGPGFTSFWFGNYYGPGYYGIGYRPWWGGPRNHLYNYYAWHNRNNPNWSHQQHQAFANRLNGVSPLPASTLAQQRAAGVKSGNGVTPLNRFNPANGKIVANNNLAANNLQAQHFNSVAKLRSGAESKGFATSSGTQSANLRLPPSPPVVRPLGTQSSASLSGISSSPPNPYTGLNRGLSNANISNSPRFNGTTFNNATQQPGSLPRSITSPQQTVPHAMPNANIAAPSFSGATQQPGSLPRSITSPQQNVPHAMPNANIATPRFNGPTQSPASMAPRQFASPQNIPHPQYSAPAIRSAPAAPHYAPSAAPRNFAAPAARPSVSNFSGARMGGGAAHVGGGGARMGGGGGGGGRGGGHR